MKAPEKLLPALLESTYDDVWFLEDALEDFFGPFTFQWRCFDAHAEIIAGTSILTIKPIQVFLNGFFFGVCIAKVDFEGTTFARGEVIHEGDPGLERGGR